MDDIDRGALESMAVDVFKANRVELKPLETSFSAELNRLERVKAVLFDVYGTLFISGSGDVGTSTRSADASLFAEALAACGFDGNEEATNLAERAWFDEIRAEHERLHKKGILYPEIRVEEIWSRVLETLDREGFSVRESIRVDPLLSYRLSVEYEARANPVSPMPGMVDAISPLVERATPVGIVSNAQFFTPLLFDAYTGNHIEEHGFRRELCVFSFSLREAKPSPRLFTPVLVKLSEKHGIVPEETVYIGNDMLNDISTSKRAGCRAILFAGDRRSLRLRKEHDDCRDVRPDAVITEWSQLASVLNP